MQRDLYLLFACVLITGCSSNDNDHTTEDVARSEESGFDVANQPKDIEQLLIAGSASWTSTNDSVIEHKMDLRFHIWPASDGPVLKTSNRVQREFFWRVRPDADRPRSDEAVYVFMRVVDADKKVLKEDSHAVDLAVGASEGIFEFQVRSGSWQDASATHVVFSISDVKNRHDPVGLSNSIWVKINKKANVEYDH